MKKTAIVTAGMLFGSSLVLGCAVHAGATMDATPPPPPPPVDVQAQVQVQGQVQGQATSTTEVDVAPAPEATAEPEEVVATSEPPEPVYEEQTDMTGPGMVWVPGYWQWTGSDWAWYYGGWNTAPEGRIYVEPYYEHVDDHVVYVRGYWGVHGEEPRYYGGDRIVFTAAVRPEGYVRGQRTVVVRSAGLRPGQRGHYGPKPVGQVRKRALPTATAPRSLAGHAAMHGEASHGETGHAEAGHEAAHEPESRARPEAKPEARPAAQPERKPAPKPTPKPRKK